MYIYIIPSQGFVSQSFQLQIFATLPCFLLAESRHGHPFLLLFAMTSHM